MTEHGAVRLTDLRKRYGPSNNAVLVFAAWSAVLALVGARRYRASLAPA